MISYRFPHETYAILIPFQAYGLLWLESFGGASEGRLTQTPWPWQPASQVS